MRRPTNKALAVLAVLREGGEMSVNQVVDVIQERTPCGACNGTGDGDDSRYGCRQCYGRGRVSFYYSDAYQALMQLYRHGLVARRRLVNEWGDETPTLGWTIVPNITETDELEALYLAPATTDPDGRNGVSP